MKKQILTMIFVTISTLAQAEGCGGKANNFKGVWLDNGQPTANYVLSIDALTAGSQGCYWIAATPQWGINSDSIEVVRVTDPNLQGGVLLAVARSASDIDKGNNSWIWVSNTGLAQSQFSEMYFNRQTLGVPR